jgi:methylmalonyl-CoA decarboxylase
MNDVIVTVDGRIATVTMCRSDKRNALNGALAGKLIEALDDSIRRNARAVILRSTQGCDVWSAGFDINEFPVTGEDPLNWSNPVRVLIRHIESLPIAVIALVEGAVWGAACELAFACDLIFATPNSAFLIPAARIGVAYDTSGLQTLIATVGMRILKEMLFRARGVSAIRLESLGIINGVVRSAEINRTIASIAAEIAGNAPLSIAAMKEELRILRNGSAVTVADFDRLKSLRRKPLGSQDLQEGLEALRGKRDPEFRGI